MNNSALLEAALEGLELQKTRIEEQIDEVRRLLSRRPSSKSASPEARTAPPRTKRELSPAARKRIAAAQKRRWAEYRKAAEDRPAKAKKTAPAVVES